MSVGIYKQIHVYWCGFTILVDIEITIGVYNYQWDLKCQWVLHMSVGFPNVSGDLQLSVG